MSRFKKSFIDLVIFLQKYLVGILKSSTFASASLKNEAIKKEFFERFT